MKNADVNSIGKCNPNPMLDTHSYDVQFLDRSLKSFNMNVSAENLYSQSMLKRMSSPLSNQLSTIIRMMKLSNVLTRSSSMTRGESQQLDGNYNVECLMAQHNGYQLRMLRNPILLKLLNMMLPLDWQRNLHVHGVT